MTNTYRSFVSALALLVLAPAPVAFAQILDGDELNLNLGNADIIVGGPDAAIQGNLGVEPDGEPALGLGEPGGVDADIDGGNLAKVGEGDEEGESRIDFSILGNGGDEEGASAMVDALGGTPVAIHVNEDGEVAGIHVDNNGDGVGDIVIPEDAVENALGEGATEDLLGLDLPVVGALFGNDERGGGPDPIDEPGIPGGAGAGNIDDALADIGAMTPAQRRAARQQCRNILSNPGAYEDSLVALCAALR